MTDQTLIPGEQPIHEQQSSTENEVTSKQIDLQDIMTLVEKLGASGKKNFLQQLSQETNISENVSNLLLKEADSKILLNLCSNPDIGGNSLDMIIQKLIGIAKGTEQVEMIIERNEDNCYEDYFDEENLDEENTEEIEKKFPMVTNIEIFLETILKNTNLSTQQIENMVNVSNQDSLGHRIQVNLCNHPNTPSHILEKIYEMNASNVEELASQHPNLSPVLREKIKANILHKQEKESKKSEISDILQRHKNLDIYQVLQYYENKKDIEVCKKLAEHIYEDGLGNIRYGAKWQFENLPKKLQLVQKYDLGEDRKIRILYDMLGDNMVEYGVLQIFKSYDDKTYTTTYLTVPEAEKEYGVQLEQEKIKDLCQKILKEMTGRYEPKIEEVEHICQIAEELGVTIAEDTQKCYIHATIDAIKGRGTHYLSSSDKFDDVYRFQKSLQLILQYKHLFTENELQGYVLAMNEKLLPIRGVQEIIDTIIQTGYLRTKLFTSLQNDGFKDIQDLIGCDVFNLIEKLELSDEFKHQIAIKKIEDYYLNYNYSEGNALLVRFNITKPELINIIVNRRNSGGKCSRYFSQEGQNSLEECLDNYGISSDEVIPSLLGEMLSQLIEHISNKRYDNAQKIVEKYTKYISNNPEFQEQIEILNSLNVAST